MLINLWHLEDFLYYFYIDIWFTHNKPQLILKPFFQTKAKSGPQAASHNSNYSRLVAHGLHLAHMPFATTGTELFVR